MSVTKSYTNRLKSDVKCMLENFEGKLYAQLKIHFNLIKNLQLNVYMCISLNCLLQVDFITIIYFKTDSMEKNILLFLFDNLELVLEL